MRITSLVLVLTIVGMSGTLDAKSQRKEVHQKKTKSGKSSPAEPSSPKKRRCSTLKAARTKSHSRLPEEETAEIIEFQKFSDFEPIPALPETPQIQPTSLVHLEKVLPTAVMDWVPRDLMAEVAGNDFEASHGRFPFSASKFQPVVPREQAKVIAPSVPALSDQDFVPADPKNLDLLWPVDTRTISSGYGPRIRRKSVLVRTRARSKYLKKVIVPYRGSHKGVDLTCPIGRDIVAAMDGVVVESGQRRGYGNVVVLDHGNGVTTLYAHNKLNYVLPGEVVRRGQKIAEVGMTGRTTGPHLHFEVRLKNQHQDPLAFLNSEEEIPTDMLAQNEAAVPPKRYR